jgi:hypothetical protein
VAVGGWFISNCIRILTVEFNDILQLQIKRNADKMFSPVVLEVDATSTNLPVEFANFQSDWKNSVTHHLTGFFFKIYFLLI